MNSKEQNKYEALDIISLVLSILDSDYYYTCRNAGDNSQIIITRQDKINKDK